jgi:hypothetical protein
MNESTGEIHRFESQAQLDEARDRAAKKGQRLIRFEGEPKPGCVRCKGTGRVVKGVKFKPCHCTRI